MARLRPSLLKCKQNTQSKCSRFVRKGRTDQLYVFIPLPLAASIGLDGGEEASVALDRQEHTTGQTIWSVGGRDYAAEEEKGEKEIACHCQPQFFMQRFFGGIKAWRAQRRIAFSNRRESHHGKNQSQVAKKN